MYIKTLKTYKINRNYIKIITLTVNYTDTQQIALFIKII